ncbi:MAG: ABC transporter substrate-binding protein [Bauldia sp.]|uniref:ABC transporter substrate-binding protein n=1 Tax=Bauldia sp. TaxID=2575872 RepID=UPI001D513973|nr:ABC transporter substrate-binding protein [Bauldia sp.]MCB1497832.1 ABC transporter substrate-binding protein [Bauldia sp.]
MNSKILRTLLCSVSSLLVAGVAHAQSIPEVPRQDTLILENIDGRVPVPDNMNPYIAGSNLDWGMWQATQESLFNYNLESGELEPWLAESGTFSPDYQTVTVKLRPGVKWSDGVDFSADDVVFTVNMLMANPGLQYSADLKVWVDSVEATDPATVVFHLKEPNPRFLLDYFGVRIWRTVLIAPKHIWEDKDPMTFTDFDLEKGWPLGTGPYRLVRSTETETVFDRRDDWWGAESGFHDLPAPKRVIWTGVGTEDARASMLVNNQLDAAWILGRSTFEIARERNPNVIAWTEDLPYAYLDACPRNLGLNNKLAPLDSKEVRHAINDAINRQQVIDIAYEGATDPSYAPFPTYPPLAAFLERNAATVDKVKSHPENIEPLMTGAGFEKGADGKWVDSEGKTVAIQIIVRSGEATEMKTAPVVVAQLQNAGFDASFQPVESANFFSDIKTGKAAAWLGGTCGSVQDPYASMAFYDSTHSAPIGEAAPGTETPRFENKAFDEAVATMAKLPADNPEFVAAADKALAIFSDELPVIPLVQARLLTPFATTYWTNWPTVENNYFQPDHWWVSGNQLILNVKPAE